jgi:hypothetical protein
MHMPDFASKPNPVTQYNEIQDSLCKSTPGFKMWEEILPDSSVSHFSPPLNYTDGGADVDPQKVIDKQSRRDTERSRYQRVERRSNNRLGHLAVSHHEEHSTKELCGKRDVHGS